MSFKLMRQVERGPVTVTRYFFTDGEWGCEVDRFGCRMSEDAALDTRAFEPVEEWRVGIGISARGLEQMDLQKLNIYSTLELIKRLVADVLGGLEVRCENMGTDGRSIDLGWYTAGEEAARELEAMVRGAFRAAGWTVLSTTVEKCA